MRCFGRFGGGLEVGRRLGLSWRDGGSDDCVGKAMSILLPLCATVPCLLSCTSSFLATKMKEVVLSVKLMHSLRCLHCDMFEIPVG